MGKHFTLGAGPAQIWGSTCFPGCTAVAALAEVAQPLDGKLVRALLLLRRFSQQHKVITMQRN